MASVKHLHNVRPPVPEVICDSPHIGIPAQMLCLIQHGRSGRKAQDYRPSAGINSCPKHFYLVSSVGNSALIIWSAILYADIIYFDKIHSPGSIKLDNRIIIFLGSRFCSVHTVHICVPAADRERMGDIPGRIGRPLYRCIFRHCLAGNSSHNMDAEF